MACILQPNKPEKKSAVLANEPPGLVGKRVLAYKRKKVALPARPKRGPATVINLERDTMSSVINTPATKGLEGIVATTSKICYIDGDRGVLAYRGIDVHELAEHSTFEETCYLLWFGRLPNRSELKDLRSRLAKERHLDPAIIRFLRDTPRTALPMDVLRTAVSALAFYDADEKNNDHEANVRKAIRLTSQIAMIVAAYDRIRKGKPALLKPTDPSRTRPTFCCN
jgi:citrate synthase